MGTSNNGSHAGSGRTQKEGVPDFIQSCGSLDYLRVMLGRPAYDPLTPEEREMLETRIAAGDQGAREEMYNRSLRYILSVAQDRAEGKPSKFELEKARSKSGKDKREKMGLNPGLKRDIDGAKPKARLYKDRVRVNPQLVLDLFQEGSTVALQALSNWEPGKASFLTFAGWHIEGAMSRYLERDRKHYYNGKNGNHTSHSADGGETDNLHTDNNGEEIEVTFHILDVTELDRIPDQSGGTEEKVAAARITLEFLELRDQLIKCLEYHASRIKNVRHRNFSRCFFLTTGW